MAVSRSGSRRGGPAGPRRRVSFIRIGREAGNPRAEWVRREVSYHAACAEPDARRRGHDSGLNFRDRTYGAIGGKREEKIDGVQRYGRLLFGLRFEATINFTSAESLRRWRPAKTTDPAHVVACQRTSSSECSGGTPTRSGKP